MTNCDAPGEREHGGSDAEGDDVGERIHLAAEIADGVGHAGDAAVQAIQHHGGADGLGGDFEMRIAAELSAGAEQRALDGANDGDESEKDIAGGEQRGQRVGGAPGTPRGRTGIEEPFLEGEPRHLAQPSSLRAQDAGAARDALARPHLDVPFGAQEHVDAGAKLDEPDAFALGHGVAGLLVEDDAARDQSGDLRETDAGGFARRW